MAREEGVLMTRWDKYAHNPEDVAQMMLSKVPVLFVWDTIAATPTSNKPNRTVQVSVTNNQMKRFRKRNR